MSDIYTRDDVDESRGYGYEDGREAGIEAATRVIQQIVDMRHDQMRLTGGELSAGEIRAVKAWMRYAIRQLKSA